MKRFQKSSTQNKARLAVSCYNQDIENANGLKMLLTSKSVLTIGKGTLQMATPNLSLPLESNNSKQPLVIEIPLTKRYVAIVDAIDADLNQSKWFARGQNGRYYAARNIQIAKKRSQITMHRLILERKLGRPLTNTEFADHIDGNRMNNRRSNLRPATQSQNMQNRKMLKSNTSGYKGVSFFKPMQCWQAQIKANGKQSSLGLFDTPEEAYAAYCEAAKELHGEFARLE